VKILFLGKENECIGFKLAGVQVKAVESEKEFEKELGEVFKDEEVGILIISDRYFNSFSKYKRELKKRAKPVVVFVPSFDGVHQKKTLKEFLYEVLGIGQL